MEFWWDSREDFTIQGHEFVDLLLDNLYVQISNHFCTSQGSIQGRVSSHQLHQGLDIRSYVISFLNGPTMWVFYFIHLLIAYQLIIYQSPVSSSIVTLAKNLLHQHIYAKIVSSSWSGTNVWITSMYVVWNVEKCKLTLALPPPMVKFTYNGAAITVPKNGRSLCHRETKLWAWLPVTVSPPKYALGEHPARF